MPRGIFDLSNRKYILKEYQLEGSYKSSYENIVELLKENKIIQYSLDDNKRIVLDRKNYKFIISFRFYETNGKIYLIDKRLFKKMNYKIFVEFKINHLDLFKPIPFVNTEENTNIDFINEEIRKRQIINDYKSYFIIGYNKNINYANKEFLDYIQKFLLSGNRISDLPGYNKTFESNINIDFWKSKGWSEEESINKISEIQKKNSSHFLEKRKRNPEKYYDCTPLRIEYWIKKGFSETEAKEKVKERQRTFSLEKCIKKYGETEGLKKFNERQKKWQSTLKSKNNYIDIVTSRCSSMFFSSPMSQDFFDSIVEYIEDLGYFFNDVFYKRRNHEIGIGIKGRGGVLYDFVIPSIKFCIEFNGERWHPRKNRMSLSEWNSWRNPFNKEITAEEKEKLDLEKNNSLIEKGYYLIEVWESEYKENKEDLIKKTSLELINQYERIQGKTYRNKYQDRKFV